VEREPLNTRFSSAKGENYGFVKPKQAESLPPDQMPLTKKQAMRLSAVSGVAVKELAGFTVAELSERLRWPRRFRAAALPPHLRRVVKRDPVTGVLHPVPLPTVHVMDTDCSFLGFFPVEWPWGWFFPSSAIRKRSPACAPMSAAISVSTCRAGR